MKRRQNLGAILLASQRVLSPIYRESIRSTPIHEMMRQASANTISSLTSARQVVWNVNWRDKEHHLRGIVSELLAQGKSSIDMCPGVWLRSYSDHVIRRVLE